MREDEFMHEISMFRDLANISARYGMRMVGDFSPNTVVDMGEWSSIFDIQRPGVVTWYPMALPERICYKLGLDQAGGTRLEVAITPDEPPVCTLVYYKSRKTVPIDSVLSIIRDGKEGDM